jgi:hypothetical protein
VPDAGAGPNELAGLLGVEEEEEKKEEEVYPVDGLLDMSSLWQIVKLPGHADLRSGTDPRSAPSWPRTSESTWQLPQTVRVNRRTHAHYE